MELLSSWGKKILDYFSHQKKSLRKFQKQHHWDKQLVSVLNKSKFPSLKQLRYLPKVLKKHERQRIGGLSLIILAALVIFLVNGYFLATVSVPKAGGEYIEGLVGSPRFINPILAQTDVDKDLSSLIFSGLLKYDKNRQLVADLAQSYEISEDQLTYTFHLGQDAFWHDGEKFNADDVVFTVASIQDPEFNSSLSRSFIGITAEKVDDNTVRFILKEPFAPFLSLLTFGILPEHLWYGIPPANATLTELNRAPIGTGAWKFGKFSKDKIGVIKSYTLVKNNGYYGDKPYLDRLIFKFYVDFNSLVDALKSKDVQGIAYLPKEFRADLEKYKNLNYHNLDQPQYTGLFLNQSNNSLLSADYIRQAIALAIDKKTIVRDIFNSEGRIAEAPSLPGIISNPDVKKYDYDPEAAVQLLEKNGWQTISTTTSDGITKQMRQKKGWYLELKLTTVDQPVNVQTAELIKKSLEQVGFSINLDIVDKSKILQDVIKTRNYESLLFSENLGTDPDPFPFWHSSQNEYPGLNLAIFTDKKVDKLLEDARRSNNWEERKEKYLEFQKIIAEELPAISLFNATYTYPQDKIIQGFDLYNIAVPADRFSNLFEWFIKTKRIWK
ncbi:MAG: peptide ABC transporter substrate-binding protein [Candidatus Buchananbacteria bacterium]|nr:peptide ABC transporter substrate-binding protein [Candidatus Buchananbacteria bacterium]